MDRPSGETVNNVGLSRRCLRMTCCRRVPRRVVQRRCLCSLCELFSDLFGLFFGPSWCLAFLGVAQARGSHSALSTASGPPAAQARSGLEFRELRLKWSWVILTRQVLAWQTASLAAAGVYIDTSSWRYAVCCDGCNAA